MSVFRKGSLSSSLGGGERGNGPEGRSQSLNREEDEGVGDDGGRGMA